MLHSGTGIVPASPSPMDSRSTASLAASPATFGDLFTPKLVTILREGYGLADLKTKAVQSLVKLREVLDQRAATKVSEPAEAKMPRSALPIKSEADHCQKLRRLRPSSCPFLRKTSAPVFLTIPDTAAGESRP